MRSEFAARAGRWVVTGIALAAIGLAVVTWQTWWPIARSGVKQVIDRSRASSSATVGDDHGHAGHDHGDHGHAHDEAASLELSPQARRNLGLNAETVRPVVLETYQRTISVPAMVVERPGRTRIQVATPLTGVITHVHAVKGEAVEPGAVLFEIRLTHEDLVRTQTEFLKTLGELDV
ncbi:MAG: secretion protein HlyD, partial [Planctomycetaceae bacterium]|nr:secretion protein HlyD [Planctomycetaceae bacterium]